MNFLFILAIKLQLFINKVMPNKSINILYHTIHIKEIFFEL